MPFLLAGILNFQGSTHRISVGSFSDLVNAQDIVYHLISTTVPSTSNQHIAEEIKANVMLSANLFEACVYQKVKKVVFISSGGTVYGKEAKCPLSEETPTNPISAYGVQKITIEKLLYLYNYMYGLVYHSSHPTLYVLFPTTFTNTSIERLGLVSDFK